jgi:small subunit ribosomal protein S9
MREEENKATRAAKLPAGKYFYGLGRRKRAVARVRLYPHQEASFIVNGVEANKYFVTVAQRAAVEAPLKAAAGERKYFISVLVQGGGKRAQADAVKLGLARALLAEDSQRRSMLRAAGLLTRDPREKERKKPGLKRARRAPQWQKR